jgi:hypothetical protein
MQTGIASGAAEMENLKIFVGLVVMVIGFYFVFDYANRQWKSAADEIQHRSAHEQMQVIHDVQLDMERKMQDWQERNRQIWDRQDRRLWDAR